MSESEDLDDIRERKLEELQADDTDAEDEASQTPAEPVHVSGPDHFEELIAEGGVVLVDFYADWCGPCQMLEPIVEELAAETSATVAKVDVDAQQALARKHQVQGVPTMQLYADGERVEQMVGVRQKPQLTGLIEQYT
jgi:thioredoxin 1